MADIDDKVMAFVEETLKKNPKIQLEDLFQRAKEVSASIRDLSKRQFNARYPLQVKRKKSQATRKKSGGRKKPSTAARARSRKAAAGANDANRDSVRSVFLQFATDIAGAEERKELVKVLANVDRYVDQVLKGIG